MKQSRIKASAIVFDQGNTLLMDPFQQIMALQKDSFQRLLQKYGINIDGDKLIDEWTRSNSNIHYQHIAHFFQEEPIIQDTLSKLGINHTKSAFLAIDLLREYRTGYQSIIRSDKRKEDVKQTLKQLAGKGKRLGVFSNDRSFSLGFALNIMEIKHFFEFVETSDLVDTEKPDPRAFRHIVDHFGIPPEQVVYVGDDPARDIDGAKEYGLQAILYRVATKPYQLPWRAYSLKTKWEADIIIDRFSELLEVTE